MYQGFYVNFHTQNLLQGSGPSGEVLASRGDQLEDFLGPADVRLAQGALEGAFSLRAEPCDRRGQFRGELCVAISSLLLRKASAMHQLINIKAFNQHSI
jgi:hypothetical protein